MPPPQALILARQKGLDLVEISPTAVPPVCRIMDYGKYQYQEQKRAREAKRHQKVIEVKEIKFRPKVDEHDYQFKKHHIERFIEDGDKVKATIFFRGREMAHPEIGHRILMRLIEDLEEVAVAETMPRQEGNQMHTILTGKKGAPKPKAQARNARAGGEGVAVRANELESRRRQWQKKQKLKTHKGAAKRFKKTGTGKIMRGSAFKRHILTEQDHEEQASHARHRRSSRRATRARST